MIGGKGIGLFLARFLIVYLLLLAPWPGLRQGYAAFVRRATSAVFGSFGSDGKVYVFPSAKMTPDDLPAGYQMPAEGRELDIHLALSSRRGSRYTTYLDTNSRKFGYLPTAFVLALIAASPVGRRRRLVAAGLGLIATQAYVGLKMFVWLVQAFSRDDPVAIYAFGSFGRDAVSRLHNLLNLQIAGTYVLPLVIWITVTFRPRDWSRISASPRGA